MNFLLTIIIQIIVSHAFSFIFLSFCLIFFLNCVRVFGHRIIFLRNLINKLKSHRNEKIDIKSNSKVEHLLPVCVSLLAWSSGRLQIIISSAHSTIEIYHMLFYILFIFFCSIAHSSTFCLSLSIAQFISCQQHRLHRQHRPPCASHSVERIYFSHNK